MLAANGDKKLFLPTAVQPDGIFKWLRSDFVLKALFCELGRLALSITLGTCNQGFDFTNLISNIHRQISG